MNDFQKIGGVAALINAATYVAALGLFLTVMAPYYGVSDPNLGQFVAFHADNYLIVFIWHVIAFLVNGAFLVVLALSLHERLKAGTPAMVQTATAFGLIWAALVFAGGLIAINGLDVVINLYDKDPAQAAMVKLALDSVETGINNSDRLAGGLWVLLLSWAALRTDGLPRALNYLGVGLGAAALISTLVPSLQEAGAIFGLGMIIWWAWLGVAMLHSSASAEVQYSSVIS
jgi:hypothetical protein